jgi:hypothetical protein
MRVSTGHRGTVVAPAPPTPTIPIFTSNTSTSEPLQLTELTLTRFFVPMSLVSVRVFVSPVDGRIGLVGVRELPVTLVGGLSRAGGFFRVVGRWGAKLEECGSDAMPGGGDRGGPAHPIGVGKPQLRPGMRALFAQDAPPGRLRWQEACTVLLTVESTSIT